MQTAVANYPWAKELEQTVVNSLTTTFGLDFLLFQDKVGGDVDTIHNVRKEIYATDKEKHAYERRGNYDSMEYHTHKEYIGQGGRDKTLKDTGQLHDHYRAQTMAEDEKRDLDHVIAAKKIHDDPGRVLAELDGANLANSSSNLQSTLETINRSKKESSISEYLEKLPGLIEGHERDLVKMQQRLAGLPRETPEQRHKANSLEDKIRKSQNKIKGLKSIDADAMQKRDQQAREKYDSAIDKAYYGGSKFLKQTGQAAGLTGLRLGTRQMLGLVMAEIWFELRTQIPKILKTLRENFNLTNFLEHIKNVFRGIWRRVKAGFKDFLTSFKEGVFGGVMSSFTTTLFNIFATTQKAAIKIIRETWGQLTKAFKLILFNPDKLGFVDLCKAVVGVMSAAVSVIVGSIAHTQLLPLCNFPFGADLAAFAGALVTGLITLGLTFTLLHSSLAQKVWAFIETMVPHAGTVKKYQAINAELDRYLTELASLELNLDTEELVEFSRNLTACNNEIERGLFLKGEIAKREIDLPFEMGNAGSTRQWLASLAK